MKSTKPLKNENIIRFADAGFRLCLLGHKDKDDDRTNFDLPGKIPPFAFTKVAFNPKPDLRKFPHNYGIVLDRDHLVIDVDPRNFPEGRNPWKELQTDLCINLEKMCKCIVRTGGGGLHLYFRKPHKLLVQNELDEYPGVEFKAHGRQVVGPGSIHPDTFQPYKLIYGSPNSLVNAPDELLERIEKQDVKLEKGLADYDDSETNKELTRQVLEGHPPAIEGQNGDEMTYKAATLCKDNGVSPEVALEMLEEYNKRCQPEWTIDELATKIKNAYRYGQNAVGAKSVKNDFEGIEATDEKPSHGSQSQATPTRFNLIKLSDIQLSYGGTWLINKILPLAGLAVLCGQPNTGKSFCAVDMGLHVAMGLDWLGFKTVQCGVAYVAAEDFSGISRRALAAKKHLGANDDVPFYLISDAPDLSVKGGDVDALLSSIKSAIQPIKFIIIDTLGMTFGGKNENDSKDMGTFIHVVNKIANELAATVLILHHPKKEDRGGMARGHSSLWGAVSTEISLSENSSGQRNMKLVKQRNGSKDVDIPPFDLATMEFIGGKDTELSLIDDYTIPIVSLCIKRDAQELKLSETEKTLLDLIPAGLCHDTNESRISRVHLRELFVQARASAGGSVKPGSIRQAMNRALDKLYEENLVGFDQTYVWREAALPSAAGM